VPRVSDGRPPAEPSTTAQRARRDRILRAAGRLGAEHGLEHVQMAEVAERAGVALGTLYRYYPSKHHLFAGLMTDRVSALPEPVEPGVGAVADLLAGACRALLARPRLARAMITSVNVVRAEQATQGDPTLRDLVLRTAGVELPNQQDVALARLVEQTTYGVLTWAAAGEITADQAEADVRRACGLLLAQWRKTSPRG
jgi:TetR/AcrR family transcriptional regulator, cholesterol catabolism regulator